MEKSEEIKLDFDTLLRMMKSTDSENVNLAISLLDSVNFKKNMVLILLLYKRSPTSQMEWKDNAPKLWSKMKRVGIPEGKISYKDILTIMQNNKVPQEQVSIFVQSVNDTLKGDLKIYGYDFIEKIEITLKPKTI